MLKNLKLNSRQYLFLIKAAACFCGLLFGGLLLAPQASMQNSNAAVKTVSNANVPVKTVSNANMRRLSNMSVAPTPELPKVTVRGRAYYEDTGRAVKRASIMLLAKDFKGREMSSLTDNSGYFQIKDVPAGTYYVVVNAPGVVSLLAYADVSKPRNEGFDNATDGFQPIVVNGITDVDVQVSARRGGAISGRVMYADGDAAIGVKVEILRKVEKKFVPVIPNFSAIVSLMTGGAGSFQTDDRGVYRFAGLPAGEYIVKVTENASHGDNPQKNYDPFGESLFGGGYSLLTTFYPDALDTEKAQIVNVALGQEQPEINVVIPDRDLFQINGKIVSAKDKSPIKNARIYLKRAVDNTFSIFGEISKRQQSDSTDEQGNWSFKELPKGTYKFVVEPPYAGSYQDDPEAYMNNPGAYTSNQNRNSQALPPKYAKKIQEIIIEDKNLSDVVIELGSGATISGTVVVENSQEMPPNITITAVGEAEEISKTTTVYNSPHMESSNSQIRQPSHDFKLENAANGKTEFRVFSDDDYYLKSVTLDGADLLVKPLELKEGETLRNVQIVLSKGVGVLKGKILDGENSPASGATFSLVPVDAAKRKNSSFYRNVTANENGEFEIKIAPNEYAIVFSVKDAPAEKGEEYDRWLDEAVKDARKVTIKANETEKISLTLPK